jgi:hypothetical protein
MRNHPTEADRKTSIEGWQIACGLLVIAVAGGLTLWHHILGLVILLASAALVFGRSVFRGL